MLLNQQFGCSLPAFGQSLEKLPQTLAGLHYVAFAMLIKCRTCLMLLAWFRNML